MQRRHFLQAGVAGAVSGSARQSRLVVLTFDDAVKSHRAFVAPLLKELGFGASFFVTHNWMNDTANFMSWQDIAELHEMGFEIGNHSWTHADFSQPRAAARLRGELALIENELRRVKVPKPVSFAYSGNGFGPEAVSVLQELGFQYARRGGSPEVKYGTLEIGPLYDPRRHHPLLIPTTADAYPNWSLDHFRKVLATAEPGKPLILQFHGVPDIAHPWVHTPPDKFRGYMAQLKSEGCRVVALRDLEPLIDRARPPADPMLHVRYRDHKPEQLLQPIEVLSTRAKRAYWIENMLGPHAYTRDEAAAVLNVPPAGITETGFRRATGLEIRPYPGQRPLRIGFRDGAIDPLRGTKAGVFLPWSPEDYVVVDLPEAIFSNLGLLFLGHTHVPTIWNEQNKIIENTDWEPVPGGGLQSSWRLPNKVEFGASIAPHNSEVRMELWLRNGADQPLTKLRTQICILLKGAPQFNAQTVDNKIFGKTIAAVQSTTADRWLLTEWDRCGRTWGNRLCPCLHSDPVLPDCPPAQTVRVTGRLWFHQGRPPSIASRSTANPHSPGNRTASVSARAQ
ncbi:MAG: polysaccharide deacetylase family protein [Bryobacterales bacterium]|nr:polysaccharide deacetylase family protein [Bryobacterales bacterium]